MYEGPVVYESHVINEFFILISVVFLLLSTIIICFSYSKIFKKADKSSWKGLIPIYNLIPLLEVVHLPLYYFFLLLIPVVQLFPMVRIAQNMAQSFKKDHKFAMGLLFLPFIFYPLLAFTEDKYIGINEDEVEEVVIQDLVREKVVTTQPSAILKTDQSISVGTVNTAVSSANQGGVLQADMSILEQKKAPVVEYIECPACKNKVKKGAPVCFICGHKF